ncbi:MAG TPA: radical SAM protein [Noviherbaspirillum sp.]
MRLHDMRNAPLEREYKFNLDPRITDPSSFRVAFVIFLDGDLVMSPEHLGVAYMAAVLRRAGFPCLITEVEDDQEGALETLANFSPQLTCFTLMSLNILTFQTFSAKVRDRLPSTRIASGGPAGTYAGLDVLRNNPYADIVAVGEGEPTIFELVQRLYLNEPLENCPGICFRAANGELVQTPLRMLMHNLDDLPFPARDQLELHGGKLEYIRISTSRGCVARCTFCSAPHAGNKIQPGKGWRGRSAESVLDELTYLVNKYEFRTYDFIDSTFEDPDGRRIGKERIRKIATGILDRRLDIYYNICMRAENWSDQDSELLQLLFESGLEKVNVGIESGTAEELDLWQKRATVEDNERIIRLLREHGIYLAMGFIQFHPYSTVDTLRRNAEFLRRNNGHNLRRLTERLEIYPGTPLISKMEADGLLNKDYWQSLDHYGYDYQDEAVAKLALHFASLYNNDDYHERGVITEQSAVFEFETFNVVLSTYLSRTQRRFRDNPVVVDLIKEFRAALYAKHKEMCEFNYEFFMSNLEDVLADKLDADKRKRDVERVENYFRSAINEIKTRQLRLGRSLLRAGADLTQIMSTTGSRTFQIAKTYTGGGTPCW